MKKLPQPIQLYLLNGGEKDPDLLGGGSGVGGAPGEGENREEQRERTGWSHHYRLPRGLPAGGEIRGAPRGEEGKWA